MKESDWDAWEAHTWSRAIKAAQEKRDGKTHIVEMWRSSAQFCGTWYTTFVDGVRETGDRLLPTGTRTLVRREVVAADEPNDEPQCGAPAPDGAERGANGDTK